MLDIRRTGSAEYGRFIKALICGPPGSGKTKISSTAPNPFYLTTEGLMMSIAYDHIPYHHVENLAQVEFALEMLKQVPSVREKQFGFPVETIVVDTIDDLAEMMLKEHCVEEKVAVPRIQDYGWLKKQLAALTGGFRNLDMNVIFTAHLKQTEVAGVTAYLPGIEGGFSDKIAGYFDLAVVLKSEMGSRIEGDQLSQFVDRYMQTTPDLQYQFIKDHSFKLPARFPLNFEDDFARMVELIFGGRTDVGILDTVSAAKRHLLHLLGGDKSKAEAAWATLDESTTWRVSDLEEAVAAATAVLPD